jgi:hypothetical protein
MKFVKPLLMGTAGVGHAHFVSRIRLLPDPT